MTTSAATPAPAPSYTFRGEGSGFFQRFAWNAGRLLSRILSVLLFRLHVSGQATLPKTGGALIVANHQSFLDPWLIGIAPTRQVHYMARDSLFKGGFLHYLAELWNAFPVKRGSADLGAIRTAVERLDKGFMLNIFPEGTRSEDGTIGPLAPGMSLILNRAKSDIPIVPTLIDGAFEAWPRNGKMPSPWSAWTHGGIRIRYGTPIPAAQWRKLRADELAARVRTELVKLQAEVGSVHAQASATRLKVDQMQPARKRQRNG